MTTKLPCPKYLKQFKWGDKVRLGRKMGLFLCARLSEPNRWSTIPDFWFASVIFKGYGGTTWLSNVDSLRIKKLGKK